MYTKYHSKQYVFTSKITSGSLSKTLHSENSKFSKSTEISEKINKVKRKKKVLKSINMALSGANSKLCTLWRSMISYILYEIIMFETEITLFTHFIRFGNVNKFMWIERNVYPCIWIFVLNKLNSHSGT